MLKPIKKKDKMSHLIGNKKFQLGKNHILTIGNFGITIWDKHTKRWILDASRFTEDRTIRISQDPTTTSFIITPSRPDEYFTMVTKYTLREKIKPKEESR